MVTEVLEYCNLIRKDQGKKPVKRLRKGVRCDPCNCPIANTIGGDCKGHYAWIIIKSSKGTIKYHYPPHITQFAKDFDNYGYPELERHV